MKGGRGRFAGDVTWRLLNVTARAETTALQAPLPWPLLLKVSNPSPSGLSGCTSLSNWHCCSRVNSSLLHIRHVGKLRRMEKARVLPSPNTSGSAALHGCRLCVKRGFPSRPCSNVEASAAPFLGCPCIGSVSWLSRAVVPLFQKSGA